MSESVMSEPACTVLLVDRRVYSITRATLEKATFSVVRDIDSKPYRRPNLCPL